MFRSIELPILHHGDALKHRSRRPVFELLRVSPVKRTVMPPVLCIAFSIVMATFCTAVVTPADVVTQADVVQPTFPQPTLQLPTFPQPRLPGCLKDGDRIVFFGDSITQSGDYVTYIEAYLLTRFPAAKFEVINHGISSETVSGLSEPGHDPPRPNAHDRFTRDITAVKPNVVVACFGMNDGIYHPFSADRFAAYSNGVFKLLTRIESEALAHRITLLTPPPYDIAQRSTSQADAKTFGYRFASADYDHVLERYAAFIRQLAGGNITVADTQAITLEHLRTQRGRVASYTVASDAVHPNPLGHWLMAMAVLKAWDAPTAWFTAVVDADRPEASVGPVSDVQKTADGVRFIAQCALPMPIDPAWDAAAIALTHEDESFNRFELRVRGLVANGIYTVSMNGKDAGRVRIAPDSGVVIEEPETRIGDILQPQHAQLLLKTLQERNQLKYEQWRRETGRSSGTPESNAQLAASIATADATVQKLRNPVTVSIELRRAAQQ